MGTVQHLERKPESQQQQNHANAKGEHVQTPEETLDVALNRAAGKSSALRQAEQFGLYTFEMLRTGADAAIEELETPEIVKDDTTKKLLGAAAAAVVGAASGAAVGWVMAGVAAALKDKAASFVGGALSDVVKKAMTGADAASVESIADLRNAFRDAVNVSRLDAMQRFVSEWPQLEKLLSVLPDEDLQALNRLNSQQNATKAYKDVKRATFVEWTNFLARAKHGAGRAWDFWAENGSRNAISLTDSVAPPATAREDPTKGNVDHIRMDWAMEQEQRQMDDEHYGILEIFFDVNMTLVNRPGYRMRLDNVGPNVRRNFRERGGRVGDLPVNKMVRLCSYLHDGVRVDPPVTVASILITADGYVRATNWAEFERLIFKPTSGPVWDPTGFGACIDQLREGRESSDCRVDRETKTKQVTAYAEAAQNLPLTLLGE